jgi:hypothetical protein
VKARPSQSRLFLTAANPRPPQHCQHPLQFACNSSSRPAQQRLPTACSCAQDGPPCFFPCGSLVGALLPVEARRARTNRVEHKFSEGRCGRCEMAIDLVLSRPRGADAKPTALAGPTCTEWTATKKPHADRHQGSRYAYDLDHDVMSQARGPELPVYPRRRDGAVWLYWACSSRSHGCVTFREWASAAW